jgi:hypothetical protein
VLDWQIASRFASALCIALAIRTMENPVRQLVSLALLSLSLCNVASADVFKSEELLQPFAETIMAKVGKGELDAAFKAMTPYMIVPQAELDSLIVNTRAQRGIVGARFGKTVGFECLGQKKVGQSLIKVTCIERTEKHALPWLFYFYKAPGGWVLNSFTWNDNLPSLFN